MSLAASAQIGFGQVRHTRLRPRRHSFAYATFFLMLPMRSLQGEGSELLSYNRRGWISFYDEDHGDGRSVAQGGALAWLDELLLREGVADAEGEVWLHCYPRVLGYSFKPVSFWYCHTLAGDLRAIVVEVNNTFGERHCYLLDAPHYGQEVIAAKAFHVSPFCRIEGNYRFRFMRTERTGLSHTVVRIDHDDAQGPLLQTSVSGVLEKVTAQTLAKARWRYPLMTLAVITRIHWHALKLWFKRVPIVHKPAPPLSPVTRASSTPVSP